MTLDDNTIRSLVSSLPAFSRENKTVIDSLLAPYLSFFSLQELSQQAEYYFGTLNVAEKPIFCQYWQLAKSKGTILICHGLFDHSGLYGRLIQSLLKQHYSVFVFDFPAHGLSQGCPKLVQSFDEYGQLLEKILLDLEQKGVLIDHALGQSTGAAALMNFHFTSNVSERLKKTILLAPLVQVSGWTSIKLSYCLMHHFSRFVPRRFTTNSHDEKFCYLLEFQDKLQSKVTSVQWVGAMLDWSNRFDQYPKVNRDALVIQGTDDCTVWWKKNIPRIERQFSGVQTVHIKSAKHHLVNEADTWRNQVFDEIEAYLN